MLQAVICLVCLFLIVLLLALMAWVISRVLRALFPGRFAPGPRRKEDLK